MSNSDTTSKGRTIPCEMIQDLLPSYIEELTSDVSNALIEDHVENCVSCKEILDQMRDPSVETEESVQKEEADRKEIDFLKKERTRSRSRVMGSILLAAAIFAGILLVKTYLIGTSVSGDYVTCTLNVMGDSLSVTAAPHAKNLAVSDIVITEKDGKIQIALKGVSKSFLHPGSKEENYHAAVLIREVRLDDRVLWSEGRKISPITSAVYNSAHPFIGDMPANGQTAGALGMQTYLGQWKNELQTGSEPYGWTITLNHAFHNARYEFMENLMRSYAYAMLAVIDNLDWVKFEYGWMAERPEEVTVTAKDATAYAGEDIKKIGKDISKLQQLLDKTGLTRLSYLSAGDTSPSWNTFEIEVANLTGEELQYIFIQCLGNEASVQRVGNGSDAYIGNGELSTFIFVPEDFSRKRVGWYNERQMEVRFTITDKDGETHEIFGKSYLGAAFGNRYRYDLIKNEQGEYRFQTR